MRDQDGKEKKVFIGPDYIHDDSEPRAHENYTEDNSLQFSSLDPGCGCVDIGAYGPFFDTGTSGIFLKL